MRWTSNKSDLHFSHLTLMSSGIGSSQPTSWQHKSWKIDFPSYKSGTMNPSGSKIELTVESIPCLVHGLSCSTVASWKQSDSTHQWMLSVRSKGSESRSKSNSFTSSALSCSGILLMTSLLLDTNLWSWKPPLLHWSLICFTLTTSFTSK